MLKLKARYQVVTLFFFVGWSASVVGQNAYTADVVSVFSPSEIQIFQDQAFDLEGPMVAMGYFGGVTEVQINATIEIGRHVEIVDPVADPPTASIIFVSVREIPVSGTAEDPQGFFYGAVAWYSKRVEANPHWIIGNTYSCQGKLPTLTGFPGSFTVIAEPNNDPGDKEVPSIPIN